MIYLLICQSQDQRLYVILRKSPLIYKIWATLRISKLEKPGTHFFLDPGIKPWIFGVPVALKCDPYLTAVPPSQYIPYVVIIMEGHR